MHTFSGEPTTIWLCEQCQRHFNRAGHMTTSHVKAHPFVVLNGVCPFCTDGEGEARRREPRSHEPACAQSSSATGVKP